MKTGLIALYVHNRASGGYGYFNDEGNFKGFFTKSGAQKRLEADEPGTGQVVTPGVDSARSGQYMRRLRRLEFRRRHAR